MLYDTPFGKKWAESQQEVDDFIMCEYRRIAEKDIDSIRNQKCSCVIPITISSGTFNYKADENEVQSIALMVMAHDNYGLPLPTYWRTHDNQNPSVTKADLITISAAMKQWILDVGAQAHIVKDVHIQNCSSKEGLQDVCEQFKNWTPA